MMQVSAKDAVLRAICEHGPFNTIDDLLLDVLPTTNIGRNDGINALVSLGRDKLVSYRESRDGSAIRYGAIRAERAGYQRAGLPMQPVGAAVGSRGATHLPSLHPGDPTDFHNQPSRAPGGPIEQIAGPRPKGLRGKPIPAAEIAKIEAYTIGTILPYIAVLTANPDIDSMAISKLAGRNVSGVRRALQAAEWRGLVTNRVVVARGGGRALWRLTQAGRDALLDESMARTVSAGKAAGVDINFHRADPAPARTDDSRPVTAPRYAFDPGRFPVLAEWRTKAERVRAMANELEEMNMIEAAVRLLDELPPLPRGAESEVARLLYELSDG